MASLFQKGSTWWVSYQLGRRQVRRSLKTKNKKIAQDQLVELEFKLSRGEVGENVPLPVEATLERFLAYHGARKAKKSAATDRVYLKRFFDAVPVKDVGELTAAPVSEYLTKRATEDKLAPKTLNRIRQVLGTELPRENRGGSTAARTGGGPFFLRRARGEAEVVFDEVARCVRVRGRADRMLREPVARRK